MPFKIESVDNNELTKSQSHIIVEIIQHIPNAVLSRTIIKKTTGNITALSFDAGEVLDERTSPFDNYIQIIDGTAEIFINEIKHLLKLGEGIIIPAHSTHHCGSNRANASGKTPAANWNTWLNDGWHQFQSIQIPNHQADTHNDYSPVKKNPKPKILLRNYSHPVVLLRPFFSNLPQDD